MKLSERQRQLITLALATQGNITAHLAVLKGGAKMNTLRALQDQELVVQLKDQWLITDKAKAAISQPIDPLLDRLKAHNISERHYMLLQQAAQDQLGHIEPYIKAKGGAKLNLLRFLSDQGWIMQVDERWCITKHTRSLLSQIRQQPISTPDIDKPTDPIQPQKPAMNLRENSKIALLISLLSQPTGVSMDQLCHVTGWQAHTVRGCFSNTLKKKLKLNLVSHRGVGEERFYRIEA